jgi:hypothetical protein
MTEAQKKFVQLEKQKEAVKLYFDQLKQATQAVAAEIGVNGMFQDEEGTVYKVVIPEGRYVEFDKIGYERTRRTGETKGSLSMTAARDAGFVVEGK